MDDSLSRLPVDAWRSHGGTDGCFAERAVTRREYLIEHVDLAAVSLNALLQRSRLLEFS